MIGSTGDERSIVHLNVADFAVAVERAGDGRLRGRPVIVAPQGASRAAVYDMSEEAYRAGVRKGMPLAQALRCARGAAVTPPHPDRYQRAMLAFLQRALPYSPLVESSDGLGHVFLDVTGTRGLFGAPEDVAWRIRRAARDELNLDPIWSVAPSKLVAKVATRIVKPTGECMVERGDEEEFLGPLSVDLLPGIESEDRRLLRELNLLRAAQVARLGLGELSSVFGRGARVIYETVRGIDPSPVLPAGQEPPSVQATWEFATDTNQREALEGSLFSLVEKVSAELRRRRLAARRMGVILDYSDGVRFVRSATCDPASANLFRLFEQVRRALGMGDGPCPLRRVRLRQVRVLADRLVFPPAQLCLFAEDNAAERRETSLCATLDRIRARFGDQAIRLGRSQPGGQAA